MGTFSSFRCRAGCGACCIAISISSPLPGMPSGKVAGVRCVNLTDDNRCRIHDADEYPAVCRNLKPSRAMCGTDRHTAMEYLARLEILTQPER